MCLDYAFSLKLCLNVIFKQFCVLMLTIVVRHFLKTKKIPYFISRYLPNINFHLRLFWYENNGKFIDNNIILCSIQNYVHVNCKYDLFHLEYSVHTLCV